MDVMRALSKRLAIKLYLLNSGDGTFTDGTFTDESMDLIKKGAEIIRTAQEKKIKKSV